MYEVKNIVNPVLEMASRWINQSQVRILIK